MTQRTLTDRVQDGKRFCGLCKKKTSPEDFYEEKIAGKDACRNCAILMIDYNVEIERSMYVDPYLNKLESTMADVFASQFKRAIRDKYFFTNEKDIIDKELFEVLYHITRGGIKVHFKSCINVVKFITKHATDEWSGKRAQMISSILVRGLEQHLSLKQRRVIDRTLSILLKWGEYPSCEFI